MENRWAGIDDELREKDPGSGAIYDAESGEFLFRVPAEYRPLIVDAVNAYPSLVALQNQKRIDDALMLEASQKIDELREENARLKEHVKDLNHDIQAGVNEANWQNQQGGEYGSY